jgi:hypothetical protein
MPKYIVTTRAAIILEADSAASALEYWADIGEDIGTDHNIVFDTTNETIAKELFD